MNTRLGVVLLVLLPLLPVDATTAETTHPLIQHVQSYHQALAQGDTTLARSLVSGDARMWVGTRRGEGYALAADGLGPWSEWDRVFRTTRRYHDYRAARYAVKVQVTEESDFRRLLEQPAQRSAITYFFESGERDRITGVLVVPEPGGNATSGRWGEFLGWARAHQPEELEALLPGGHLAPFPGSARRWQALMTTWRGEAGGTPVVAPAAAATPSVPETRAEAPVARSPEPYPIERFLRARAQSGVSISPDGGSIVYLDNITGTYQAWRLDLDCGWPEQITFLDDEVAGIDWSPRHPEHLLVVHDTDGDERFQLYRLDPVSLELRGLTGDREARCWPADWSPDGRSLAFRSNARDPALFDAYEVDIETGAQRILYQSPAGSGGILGVSDYAPDGDRLLLVRTVAPDETDLVLLDLATGATSALTPDEPRARHHYSFWSADGRRVYTLTDRDREDLTLAAIDVETGALESMGDEPWPAERLSVSADGSRLALGLNRDGYSELRLHDLIADRPLPAPALPPGVIYGLDFTPDGGRLAVVLMTASMPSEVFVYDLERRELIEATRSSLAGIPRQALSVPELVRYPSFDGLEIPAFLYRPAAPAAPGPLPCLIYAHGGPSSQSRPRYSSLTQYFSTRGYVVFTPNVRGSSGYGRRFLNLDNKELREDSVADLRAGVEWLIEQGIADPERIAVHGGSYGGYMVLAALSLYPDLWAAGVDRVGIANFVSFLENTGAYRRSHREQEYGSLEHDRALLERLSPLGRVDRIRAPLMVIHGANDPRVPVEEAEQIVGALRERGRPVEYLRYEDEGHGLDRLENRLDAYRKMADFLDRYLAPQETAAGAP